MPIDARSDALRLGAVVASQVAWLVGRFAIFVFVGRALGSAGTGDVAIALAVSSFVALLAGLGLKNGAVYFLPKFRIENDNETRIVYLRATIRWIMWVSALLVVASGLVVWLGRGVAPVAPSLISVATVHGGCTAILAMLGEVLRVDDRPHISLGVTQGAHAVLALALVAVALRVESSAFSVVIALALAAAITAAALVPLTDLRRQQRGPVPSKANQRSWIRFSLPFMLSGASLLLLSQLPVIIVGWRSGVSEAGGYATAYRIASLPLLLTAAIGSALGPRCVTLLRSGDIGAAKRRFRSAVGLNIVVAIPFATVIVVLRSHFLGMFGPEFASFDAPVVLLAVGLTLGGIVGPVAYVLSGAGRNWEVSISYAIVGLVALVGCVIGATAVGASWVIAVAMIVQGTGQLWLLHRATRLL